MITDGQVKTLVNIELKEANEKFPLFNSLHEGQSVLHEEIEEAGEDIIDIFDLYEKMWKATRENNTSTAIRIARLIKNKATHMIKESIQVAAMADKVITSAQDTAAMESISDSNEHRGKKNEPDQNKPADPGK